MKYPETPGRDSMRSPLKHKSEALPLEPSYYHNVFLEELIASQC